VVENNDRKERKRERKKKQGRKAIERQEGRLKENKKAGANEACIEIPR
jgi:hypothetical protein